ncbi:protein kinase [Motilimonas sp. 1_MG-2023]|uniref:serine/threonine protein kinase n=1 Tax=Motilimonas sp. 1_MG-2023 TaxID=3062672 RepID=UPI0026E2691D|nr:protein kinase [Motilimonas sp. 1_MG-2023]MDO6524590.1 protein kinase [Motilimonas sp. 1_MG-2023]
MLKVAITDPLPTALATMTWLQAPTPLTPNIYVGEHAQHGWVKIKLARSQTDKQLLQREIQALKHLSNAPLPYIARYISSFEQNNSYYLLTPWLKGEPLSNLIRQNRAPLFDWRSQLATALSHCHQLGFNHGDIKPSNILVMRKQIVLLDFGASLPHGESLSRVMQYGFSPHFCHPELLTGQGIIRPCHDWYAFAVTVLSAQGMHPFNGLDILSAAQQRRHPHYPSNSRTCYQLLVNQAYALSLHHSGRFNSPLSYDKGNERC